MSARPLNPSVSKKGARQALQHYKHRALVAERRLEEITQAIEGHKDEAEERDRGPFELDSGHDDTDGKGNFGELD